MNIKITHIKPVVIRKNGEKVIKNNQDYLCNLVKTCYEEIAKLEKTLSNDKSKPCESPIERLAMFFEETAAEIRSMEVDTYFMMSLIAEVTKAMVRTHDEVEREEDRDNAS